jgi:sulfate adenylyltransferase
MELYSRHLAGTDTSVTFDSAGTRGFQASEMDPTMAATLVARGVDPTGFRSRPFTAAMLEDHDLVLTAEASHRQFILDDHPAAFRKVFTLGQFAQSTRDLGGDLAGRDLLAAVAERRAAAEASLDVDDPYRRGPEAAEACAASLETLLRAVVPALAASERITL